MYLERRRRKWYALHEIPADVRPALGKPRFCQSLDTEDKAEARRRAALLEVQWRSEIEEARKGTKDHLTRDAAFWRKLVLRARDDTQRDLVLDMLGNELDSKVNRAAERAGILDTSDPAYEQLPERLEANRVYAIASGTLTALDAHLEEYLGTLKNEAKTVDMKRSSIKRFCEDFPYVADVHKKDVQRWVNKQAQDGKAVATIRRSLSELRGYWDYLQAIETVGDDHRPFDKLAMPKENGKASARDVRQAFEAADVVTLLSAAVERKDDQLADLIRLGMWTGARIEELCAMKLDKVGADYLEIEDAKTAAGWRRVPIHSRLKPTVDRLKAAGETAGHDGYLLSGLSPNKYGDRSNAVGKRFGRLKTDLKFNERFVFHSIRKTVATLLENAGVPENVSADIIGHDKPTMTYGLYSGGVSLEVKREALEKIGYPSE